MTQHISMVILIPQRLSFIQINGRTVGTQKVLTFPTFFYAEQHRQSWLLCSTILRLIYPEILWLPLALRKDELEVDIEVTL